MPNTDAATKFLTTLNGLHPSLSFTMVLPVVDRIPFIGIEIMRMEQNLKLKSIESQPILAYCYISIGILINAIKTLLNTMLHRAYALSSTSLLMKNAQIAFHF